MTAAILAVVFGVLAVVLVWRWILSAHTRPWTARDVAVTAAAGGIWWCLAAIGRETWWMIAVAAAHLTVAAAVTIGRTIRHGKTPAECSGICVMAGELIGGMPMDQVAIAHPDCDLHGHLAWSRGGNR